MINFTLILPYDSYVVLESLRKAMLQVKGNALIYLTHFIKILNDQFVLDTPKIQMKRNRYLHGTFRI